MKSKWKTIWAMSIILLIASSTLAATTLAFFIMKPSSVLLTCFVMQLFIAAMQLKILKVSRTYVQ